MRNVSGLSSYLQMAKVIILLPPIYFTQTSRGNTNLSVQDLRKITEIKIELNMDKKDANSTVTCCGRSRARVRKLALNGPIKSES